MKLRRSVAVLVAACGLSMTGVAGAAAAQAAAPSSSTVTVARALRADQQLTLQQLLDRATHKVRGTYPNASLMLADGESPTGPTRDMEQVTDWRLIYNTNDAANPVKSLLLYTTLDGEISAPVLRNQPWGGVVRIPDQVAISPTLAYSILNDAGHDDPYQFVSLVKPLIANPKLQYHFSNIRGGCDGYSVNVDDFMVNPIC